MNRIVLRSEVFVRAARKLAKKHPGIEYDIETVLRLLAVDAFHPQLKTHKLKGNLKAWWSCSAGYDLRIVFTFVQHEGAEAVLLQTVGTHDEAY